MKSVTSKKSRVTCDLGTPWDGPGQLRRMLKFLSRMSLLFSGNNSSSGKSGDKIKKKSVNRKIEGSAGGQSSGGGSRVERTRPPLIEGRAERAK